MLVLLDFSALSRCQTRNLLHKHRGTLTTQPLSINRFIKILFWMTWSCKHLSIKLKNNFSILNQIIGWLWRLLFWNVQLTAYSHWIGRFEFLRQGLKIFNKNKVIQGQNLYKNILIPGDHVFLLVFKMGIKSWQRTEVELQSFKIVKAGGNSSKKAKRELWEYTQQTLIVL